MYWLLLIKVSSFKKYLMDWATKFQLHMQTYIKERFMSEFLQKAYNNISFI